MSEAIRVLHVDDDPDFADMAAERLRNEDERFVFDTATHPEEALGMLDVDDVDCVVSDYDMPGQNGIEFLDAVRAEHPDLPFILFTGKGSEAIASEAISAGVTDYLRKGGDGGYAVLAHRIATAVERYRSRRALEATERKLSQIAENTDDVLFLFDGDWSELLFINSAYEDVWGGSVAELERDPTSFLQHVHPEDKEKAMRSMERLASGEPDAVEYRIVSPDGERRWVHGETTPILDDDGNVDRIAGYVRDVTDRKERTRQLETLISNLPGIVYRCRNEPGWPMEFVRGECEALTGHPSEAIERGDVVWGEDVIHPDDRDRTWEVVQDALAEDRPFEVTYRIHTDDGTTRWMWERGRPVEAVHGTVLEGFITDVTDRKETERELREKSNLLDQLFTQIPIHMYVKDTEARHLRVSEHFTDDPEDVIGKTDRELFPPAFGEETYADDMEVIETGEPILDKEEYLPFRDEWHLTSKVPWYGDGGGIRGLMGVTKSITERKEYERELERQNERLNEFAEVVSHDLRNPLNVAEGRLDLARAEHDGEHLEHVARAHERMETLIEDLLALAREGEQVSDAETVQLGTFVPECWATVDTADARLDVRTSRTVRADPTRLAQLFENLFRNAVEHGAASTRSRPPEDAGSGVTIVVGDLDDGTGFYVEDDGPGIPAENSDRVFEAGHSTTDEGTGFGLSIVKEIVDAHGWEITVTDGEAGGARFEISGIEPVRGEGPS